MKKANETGLAPVVLIAPEAVKAAQEIVEQRNPNDLIIMNAEVTRNGQKYAFIPVSEIDIDMNYQRQQSERAVNKLIANWNEELYEPIKVAYRDGKFRAWDGGKRLRAQIKMGRENVYCRLCEFKTMKEEVESFITSGKCLTKLSPRALFKAELFNGKEPQVTIKRICDDYNITICLDSSFKTRTDREISNVTQLQEIFKSVGEDGLRWVFDTIHYMNLDWEGKRGYNAKLLKALSIMYSKPIIPLDEIQKALNEFAKKKWAWVGVTYRTNAKKEFPMLEDIPAIVNFLESVVKEMTKK